MPDETGTTQQNGQQSEGKGADAKIDALAQSINTIKDVVGDLATKVSEMDRNMSESRELDAILRSTTTDDIPDPKFDEPPPKVPENATPQQLMEEVIKRVGGAVDSKLSEIDNKVNQALSSLEVKQYSTSDPSFEKEIRPLAYKISKEPGKQNWAIKDLVEAAKGRLAMTASESLRKENETLKTELTELKERASLGDKPGFFGGTEEPEQPMDEAEAFDKAWKDSGASKMMG